jgi:phospho-N-acetylmuramoyl-pentapeptide-transferase
MIVELVPVPLQILSVKLRKKRLFPFTPIHHAFQRAGWSEIKIVGLFFFVQLAGSIIGFLLVSRAGQ